jgi:peptidoglycan/xylan/chitin deacetylase (PgdA/CDA1 family)
MASGYVPVAVILRARIRRALQKDGAIMSRALIYRIAGLTGLNLFARAVFRGRLLVLAYHGVCGEEPDVADPDGLHTPARLFERQLEFLKRSYRPVSLKQVRDHFIDGAALPGAAVLITFDDGYRNVARHAAPVLKRMGVPCVLFLAVGLVEAGKWLWTSELEWRRGADADFARLRNWLKSLTANERQEWLAREFNDARTYPECEHTLMSWEEIVEARRDGHNGHNGLIEIGSHGLNHDPLTGCGGARLENELGGSRLLLRERVGVEADAVAYPNGEISDAVIEAAAAAGYRLGFTTEARHARKADHPLALPRILVGRRDTLPVLAARLAGWQEWLRGMRNGRE